MNARSIQWLNGRSLIPDGIGTCTRMADDRGSIDWSYAGAADWATKFTNCGGKFQSPIDLTSPPALNSSIAENATLKIDYKPLTGRSLTNNGHGIQIDGEFGTFTLPRAAYKV